MLKRDIGGHWPATGQPVKFVSEYFAGQTGVIVGCCWITGECLVRMDKTGHVLPFSESDFVAYRDDA